MLTTSFLQLHTALYEWGKECPRDLRNDLDNFFASRDFLDRQDIFFKGNNEEKNSMACKGGD